MKTNKSDLLRQLLDRADIPPHAQREILNAFFSPKKDSPEAQMNEWDELTANVKRARFMLLTNKTRWLAHIRPLYAEYVDIMSVVISKIAQARLGLGLDGKPMPLAEYTEAQRATNVRRKREFKRLLPACDAHWQSWVPPHIRAAFTQKVEEHYAEIAAAGTVLRGGKFTPFVSRELKREDDLRIQRIVTTLKGIKALANRGTYPYPQADTLYAALYLCAGYQAERALRHYKKRPLTLDDLCPVNWMYLLDSKMRSHLREVRAADKRGEALDIPVEWCRDFYFAPQEGKQGEDVDILSVLAPVQEVGEELDAFDAEGGEA